MSIADLGPPMSMSDEVYNSSAAHTAGFSGTSPECECPGFDPALLPSPEALVGRWVRSPKKFVGWDTYMEFFGLTGDKALQETEEPQEHVILAFSKDELRLRHRLPWRDGLDAEYTIPIDGSSQPIPPAMVARASSSWKVNDLMSWVHAWDEGDGNPLHRGLRTEQKLKIGDTNYALRYWRSLIRPGEMRVNVEVTHADTGAYAVHTQRFFTKVDVERVYAAACSPVSELPQMATWTHEGRGVRLAVIPHASNMAEGWAEEEAAARWEKAEPFPSAGRSSGPYLTTIRQEAREAGLWVVCGVVLRGPEEGHGLLKGVALIGADGWLHSVHTDASPTEGSPYVAGSGDWPATQRARPNGVIDTEIGRIALCTASPAPETVATLAGMGAELIVVPPEAGASPARAAVCLTASDDPSQAAPHSSSTSYALCGPEPLVVASSVDTWHPTLLAVGEDGVFCAKQCSTSSA